MLAAVFALACVPPFLVDRIDAPLVLASGLGEIRSLAIGPGRTLLAATPRGVVSIDAAGTVASVAGGEGVALAVTRSPRRVVRLLASGLDLPAAPVVPGARDLAAAWFEELLVLGADALWAVREDGASRVLVRGLGDARAVAPGAREGRALVVAGDGLVEVVYGPEGGATTSLVATLPGARAAAVDSLGGVVLAGSDGLYRVSSGSLVPLAKVGAASDLVFAELVPAREDLFAAEGGAVLFWRAGD